VNLHLLDGARDASASARDGSAGAPAIPAAATALPPNVVEQQSVAALLRSLWGEKYEQSRRWRSTFDQIQRSVRIDRRYLALPIADYPALDTFAKSNAAWARIAPMLGAVAAERALDAAGLGARDVDHLFFVTGTGIATPSLDARIVNRLGDARGCEARRGGVNSIADSIPSPRISRTISYCPSRVTKRARASRMMAEQ
jgi:predicted naringenin-chalcone synthase